MPFIIEPPSPDDTAALAQVYLSACRQAYRDILPKSYLNPLNVNDLERVFRRKMAHPRRSLLVARRDQEIIGYGYFGLQSMPELPFDGEIVDLYIHPKATGQGAGKQLVSSIMAAMVRAGLTSCNVWSLSANAQAGRFYTELKARKLIEGPILWNDIENLTFDAVCYYWPALQIPD